MSCGLFVVVFLSFALLSFILVLFFLCSLVSLFFFRVGCSSVGAAKSALSAISKSLDLLEVD